MRPSYIVALQATEVASFGSGALLEHDDLDNEAVSEQEDDDEEQTAVGPIAEVSESEESNEQDDENDEEVDTPLSQGTAEALESPSKNTMPESYIEALRNPASADPEVLERALAWAPEVQTPSELLQQAKANKETKTRGMSLQ